MARNDKNTTSEVTYNSVATQFIKYGGEHVKPGDKFQVKESDVKELANFAEIEIPEKTTTQPVDLASGQDGQAGGSGGQ